MTSWTPERRREVKSLAALGLKPCVIGKALGVTRGAIAGIIYRMERDTSIEWIPLPKPIPTIHTEPPPPEPGTVCAVDDCRGPRQRGDRLGRCDKHIRKDIMASKEDKPTLVDPGRGVRSFEVARGRGKLV